MWPWRRNHNSETEGFPARDGRLLVLSTRGCRTEAEAIYRTCLGLPVERLIERNLDALNDYLGSGLMDLGGRIAIWHPRGHRDSGGGIDLVITLLSKEAATDSEAFEDIEEIQLIKRPTIPAPEDPHSLAAVVDATECEHHLLFVLTTTHVATVDEALAALHAQLPGLRSPAKTPELAAENLAVGLGMLIAPDVTVWWENGQHDARTPSGQMIHRILLHAAELAPHQTGPDITPTHLHIVLGPAPEATQQEPRMDNTPLEEA